MTGTSLIRRMRAAAGCMIALSALGCLSPMAADAPERAPRGEFEFDTRFPASPQAPGGGRQRASLVFKEQVKANWFSGTRFWYRNELRAGSEFVLVDAESGVRTRAFDHERLAQALAEASGKAVDPERLPFTEIEFADGAVQFAVGDAVWQCELETYRCVPAEAAPRAPVEADTRESRERRRRGGGDSPIRSPDGKWTARIHEHNVHLRSESDGTERVLSDDGMEGNSYGRIEWAPDSSALVVWRVQPGERKEVFLIRSAPPGGGRAVLERRPYDLPGDTLARHELNLFLVKDFRQIKPDIDRFEHGWQAPRLRWSRDAKTFAYVQVDRGHQRLRVVQVDAERGSVRNIIDERSETFIWTVHTENLRLELVNWLEQSDELIYASEQDGWRHLYLVDAEAGGIRNQITRGNFVVRGIDWIDEANRQVWFHAGGVYPDQDPYFIHYCRVNFDGSGFVVLTEGNGTHRIEYSPDRQYFVDTYSRVDQAPVHELRRAADGQLISLFEKADIADLERAGWRPPDVFVAKGRDGKTDIWGIISHPKNFDPNVKYPVIEDIYAGPQGSYVPKSFSARERWVSLTELGFVVVKVDGMGTANRSKAFHDVCWKNLKDAGFSDRILWMKAAAERYPHLDLSRVGVYGNSAGGQNAAGAVLFHPEFYKAAVASCGCHDNRMDKASWNEQWMGYPVGPQYAECSNIDNAHRLQGKLFLIVGELDRNVPPESTLRFVDALVRAQKDFDLLVIPGGGHGMGGSYGQRRMQDFFVRHLLNQEPPDRN